MRTRTLLQVTALVFLVSGASPSFAQSDSMERTTLAALAVSTGDAESNTTAAPVPGKNSFTESEARKRLESFGYSDITALNQDDQSVWRGEAMKDGQRVAVSLDYQGNITAR